MFSIDTHNPQYKVIVFKMITECSNEFQITEALAYIMPSFLTAPLLSDILADIASDSTNLLVDNKAALNEADLLGRISRIARILPSLWMQKYSIRQNFNTTLQKYVHDYQAERSLADILGIPIEVTEPLILESSSLEDVKVQLTVLAKIERFYVSTYSGNATYYRNLFFQQLPQELHVYYADIFDTTPRSHFDLTEAIAQRAIALRNDRHYQTALSRNSHHALRIAVQERKGESVKIILLSCTREFLPQLDEYSPHIKTLAQALEHDYHSLLWLAAGYSSSEIFKIIIRCYPPEMVVNILVNSSHKLLFTLAKNGKSDLVKILLGIYPPHLFAEALEGIHHIALFNAAKNMDYKTVKILLIAYYCTSLVIADVLSQSAGFIHEPSAKIIVEKLDSSTDWGILDVGFSLNERAFDYLKQKGGTYHEHYSPYLLEQLHRVDCHLQLVNIASAVPTNTPFMEYFCMQVRSNKVNIDYASSVDANSTPNHPLSKVIYSIIADGLEPEQKTEISIHLKVEDFLNALLKKNMSQQETSNEETNRMEPLAPQLFQTASSSLAGGPL